jgi:phage FluMu protein Com
MMPMLKDVRCGACSKLLARALFERVQIKCSRCSTLNDVRAKSPQLERLGASCEGVVNGQEKESAGMAGR